ncbi:MAG: glucose-6-phosphate isomerase, partial [Limnobacter sp.]|nr:glucose-6-phosphate isomerase [Limnobacter sp.]
VFNEFLSGGAAMDVHALRTNLQHNLPCLLALCDYINLQNGVNSLMLSPYDSRLGLLVPYLQQLWMESLGKGVTNEGERLQHSPCPVLWGDVGTNGQHAFFQMLHQSPIPCGVELLAVKQPNHDKDSTHQVLMSHFLAQAEGFAKGKLNSSAEIDNPALNHKTCPGNRPVTSLIMKELSPAMLGSLLALWEHRTAALAALNHINPFDQWGVELGKVIAQELETPLSAPQGQAKDPVTNSLLQALKTKASL